MRVFAAALALVFLAAATPAAAQTLLRLDAESNAQSVTVAVGDTIVVALDVSEQSSAEWFVVSAPDFLTANGRLVSRASIEGSRDLLAKTYLYRFHVSGAGAGDIVLEQRDPDASEGAAPIAMHRVTINAGS